ncbi:uncharacterized protein LOC126159811 [Schistocerca cancellata]|uniref:uncharacterized protein LOC126159811 n=1 Tax=Schistocerca cancellata TaxID=274614 RepID=UPI0021179BB3|nr:uncharacterized protein LOC126159811 [Schistocerca cancellata]
MANNGNLLSHFSAILGVPEQVSLSFRPLVALEGIDFRSAFLFFLVLLLLLPIVANMKRSRTSELWSYFEILDREFTKCTLCGKKLSYKSTTTNLKKHLQKSHLIVNFSSQRPSELDLGETLPVEVILGTSSVEEERAAPAPSMQQGVQSSMTSYLSKRIGVNQKRKIDGQLLQLFTKDFQPFSVVEDSGFCVGP